MIYTSHEKLTIYIMTDESDKVHFSELGSILMERPSNMIYCEKNGKLYGIISMGDIARANEHGKDFVVVNKKFTSVKPNEYMRIRQIFKNENRINALPVVSAFNELLGDYSRWDDIFAANDFEKLKLNKYAAGFWKKNWNFALVRPCKDFTKKQELMRRCKENLLQAGVRVSIINREEVMENFERVDCILFTDEDEKRGTGTLYKDIFCRAFNWDKAKTYNEISKAIDDEIGNVFLSAVLSKGVYVYTLNCWDNKSDYSRRLRRDISDKFYEIGEKISNRFHEKFREKFFAELYSEEYAKEILDHKYARVYMDGICKLRDADTRTYKAANGERKTVAQPPDSRRCIYFYGACFVIGWYVADEHTIESFLQARLNAEGYKVKCVNYGAMSDWLTELGRVVSTRFNKGDVIIFYNRNRKYKGVPSINLIDICEKYEVPATWMVDDPRHCNHKLNSIYADEIFERIKPIVQEEIKEIEPIEMRYDFLTLGYFDRYFYGFAETNGGVIGSIVMNCNPFTSGHRYLIEQALKQVDHLIIFVVEEDKSVFTFKERLAMVTEGTRDLENVTVVPSGNYILSQTTFPEYFLKIADEDIIHNVEYDITLFAEKIAPKLNITYRFVGEEPEDEVTNEYNKAMKRILPEHGINIVEIPRAEINGQIISASSVRKKLANADRADIDKLIPKTTKKILDMCWE